MKNLFNPIFFGVLLNERQNYLALLRYFAVNKLICWVTDRNAAWSAVPLIFEEVV